jgi:hypothetical protein
MRVSLNLVAGKRHLAGILAALLSVLAFGGNLIARNPVPPHVDSPLLPGPKGLTGDAVFAKVLERNGRQDALLREYSEVRTYQVRNTKGRLVAQAIVQVNYQAPGEKTFRMVSEEGSWMIRHKVFERLVSAEKETASRRGHRNSALTDANYKFTLLGEQDLGPYRCFVVEATPRTRSKYLFEGRIWVNDQDFAIVRIAGHPSKKLSFWIHRVEFVRQYQRIGEYWLPYKDDTWAEVRFYGERIFTVEHLEYTVNGSDLASSAKTRVGECAVLLSQQ